MERVTMDGDEVERPLRRHIVLLLTRFVAMFIQCLVVAGVGWLYHLVPVCLGLIGFSVAVLT